MEKLTSEYDFENAPCGYLSFSPDGTITQINQTLLQWIGYKKEEVVGVKKLDEITARGTRLYLRMFVYPLLKLQGYINELSMAVVSSDQSTINCLFNASVIKNEDGSIRQIHAILFSIAQRKQFESDILHAKKIAETAAEQKEHILQIQRRIMSILGHDTRAPLVSINRIIKFAAEGKLSPQEVFPYFELMANQLDATLILINDLLNWSNLHFNNAKEKEEPYSLQEVTAEVFELLQGSAAFKNLHLSHNVDPAIFLFSNKSIVTFIIRNLVNNAIKFTRQGGVTVSASAVEDAIRIVISDTGEGMEPDQLEKYNSGQPASTPGTNNEKGSGMGIVLIKEFLLQLNGSLKAESTPGNGTQVTVSLPRTLGKKRLPV